MISQCEIRKLYARKAEPQMDQIIEFAKGLERRRCGHLPEDFPEPLSTNDCFKAVVDPKDNKVNKHKLVVVCQDDDVRRGLRAIPGVPQIYLKRSVMILEPMATQSAEYRAKEERSKYRAGLRGPAPMTGAKRKRDDDADADAASAKGASEDGKDDEKKNKKKKTYGPKGANPLATQKKKDAGAKPAKQAAPSPAKPAAAEPEKKKRKRKHKSTKAAEAGTADPSEAQLVEKGVALEA